MEKPYKSIKGKILDFPKKKTYEEKSLEDIEKYDQLKMIEYKWLMNSIPDEVIENNKDKIVCDLATLHKRITEE